MFGINKESKIFRYQTLKNYDSFDKMSVSLFKYIVW